MDPLNLILLIIVVLIGWRLRSVLGTRNDDEKPSSRADAYRLNRDAYENPSQAAQMKRADNEKDAVRPEAAADDNAGERDGDNEGDNHDAPDVANADDAPPMGRGLAYLREIDPGFDEAGFLDGAARAYEMILTAFANDDLAGVQGFLGDEVAAGFESAIAARQAAGQKLETRILRLDRPALDDAEVEGDKVRLDVRLRAEIITAGYAANAALDEDNLPSPATHVDIWSFEGAHNSASPNWKLVATRAD
jgi:predicted lipid-binding transport protein (Tim44 family)